MKFSSFLFFLLTFLTSYGQTPLSSNEVGVWVGDAYYLGELNKTHFVPFNLGLGAFYRYNYDDRIGGRIGLTYGKISGADSFVNNNFNNGRDFSFQSRIIELNALLEFNFLSFSHLNDKGNLASPYFFLGFSLFHHQAQGNSGGTNINFFNGQSEGVQYRNLQLAIPLGGGIKFLMGKFGLALEWGIRKTFTDYLDQISAYYHDPSDDLVNFQRGDVFTKDWYVFSGITLFSNITPKRKCPI